MANISSLYPFVFPAFIVIIVVLIFSNIISRIKHRSYQAEALNDALAEAEDGTDKFPYHSKYLLTRNEWNFYRKLKYSADRRGLHILSKVRLADLVEVDRYCKGNAFNKYFWKIQAKHVDFVLCNPENLAVKAIIELEDSTHSNSAERARRDDFVDKVLKKCGYPVIYTYSGANIEELIDRSLS